MVLGGLSDSETVLEQILDRVTEIALRINDSLDVGEILKVAVREVRAMLESDRALIYRFLRDGDGVVAEESASPESTPILGQLIYDPCFNAEWVDLYRQGRIGIIEDIDANSFEPCYRELLTRLQIRANLVVPILLKNQDRRKITPSSPHLWGLLIVHQCSRPRQWHSLEIKFVKQVAVQMGIALQKLQLHQQLRCPHHDQEIEAQQPPQELKQTQTFLGESSRDDSQTATSDREIRAIAELQWKEALLRSMTDTSRLAFYVVDNRTDEILYFNHRFCEIWGIEHLEQQMRIGALKNNDLIPDCLPSIADVPAFAESCKPLQSEENRCTVEDEIKFVDGRTIRRFSSQIRDIQDRYFGRLYIFEDISDRKQTEAALRESEERYRSAIAAMAEGIVQQHADGRITACNNSAERILGLTADQMMGRTSLDPRWRSIHEDGSPFPGETHPSSVTLRTGKPLFNVVMGVHKPDGNLTWISINSQPLFQPNRPQPYAVVTSFTDITVRKQAEETLRQQAERERMIYAIAQRIRQSLDLDEILNKTVAEVRHFLQTDRVIIYRFNPDWSGVVVKESVAEGWASILNMEITDTYFVERAGQPYQQNNIKVTPDIYAAGFSDCHIALLEQLQVRAKLVVPILQGDLLWGLLVAHHCSDRRDWHCLEIELIEQLATQVAIAIQQSELHQQLQVANQQLQNLAMLDQLTQIANRRHFDKAIAIEWQRLMRERQPLSLLLCDIDYFKQYNDTYGHAAGDTCLTLVAQALKQAVQRSADLVARYGGEEFAVILPNTDSEGAFKVAQKIREALQQLEIPHLASKVDKNVTMSIGIATVIPVSTMEPLELIEEADRALYQAKASGRNCSFARTL